ncbi:MAG: hypothetical protein KDA24_05695 [Deltaproteobacteria bacterium]|nr:hypothetical protein [Deltaproteobacteria bacterium]
MSLRPLLLLLVLALGVTAPVVSAEPASAPESPDESLEPAPPAVADPDALWAEARRAAIPAWDARAASALTQVELARAYFAGSERLDVAFPAMGSGALHRLGWLDSRLADATGEEMERLKERAAPVPPLGSESRLNTYRRAREGALDAEDLAGSLERRLLLGLRGLATDHPQIAGDGYGAERARLVAIVSELDLASRELEPGEARDLALARIGRAQRDVRRLDALAGAARRHITVPGAATPLSPGELGRLSVDGEATGAADRLERMRPLLPATEMIQVDAALASWLRGTAIPAIEAAIAEAASSPPSLSADVLTRQVEERATARVVAETMFGLSAPAEPGTPAALRREVLELRARRAALELELAEAMMGSVRRHRERRTDEEAKKAAERAEESRREAEEAAAKATDERSRQLAALLESVASAQTAAESEWTAHRAAVEAFESDEAEWSGELRNLTAEVDAILLTPTGIGSLRRGRAVEAWVALHNLLTTLRKAATASVKALDEAESRRRANRSETLEERASLEKERIFVSGLGDGPDRATGVAALDDWEVALSSMNDAIEERLASTEDQRDAAFATLRQAKNLREELRPSVPGRDRVQTSTLFEDINLEVRLFAPNLRALLRRRLSATLHLPTLLSAPETLFNFILQSFWLILLLIGGLWARARLPFLVEPMVLRLNRQERQLFQRDFRPLVQPVTVVAVAALDLMVLSLMLGPVRDRLPELGILLILVRIGVLFRLVDGLFRLAVAPASERRPALVAVSVPAWPLVARAERLLLLWLLLGTLVQYVIGEVIGAEALAWLAAQLFLFAFLGLGVFLLHLSEPHVRAALVAGVPDGPVTRYLAEPPRSGLITRAPRAALGIFWLGGLRLWQLLQGTIEEGTLLGRVLNVVNRRRLSQDDEESEAPPLSSTARSKIDKPVTAAAAELLYRTQAEEADASLAAWREEGSRGLVLVVGDRGQGKHVLVTDWAARSAGGLEQRTGRLTGRVVGEKAVFIYVARQLGLEGVSDAESFQRELRQLPPTLFLLEELENAFLRRVGGFAGLRSLLRVLNDSCDRHFWVLTVHAPAWRLLERIGTVVNPNTFRTVIRLPRLGGAELGDFLTKRTAAAGYSADFGPLGSSTASGQPAAEVERTQEAYFRLLAEASGGNPGVAVPLWARSLCPSNPPVDGVESKVLRVRLPDVISNPQLPPLSDPALLTLAVVRVHGGLSLNEIVQANNMEPDLVQSTVQVLDNLGLLHRRGARYSIDMGWLAAVTRLLRRRHFVYGKDAG